VDERAEQQQPDRVGTLKGGVDASVVGVAPPQLVVEDRLQQRQDLTVDVVDRGRQKQQQTDQPAIATHRARCSVHGCAPVYQLNVRPAAVECSTWFSPSHHVSWARKYSRST